MKKPARINLKVFLIIMGGFTLLMRYLFSLNPQMTEKIYSRGIFLGIRFFLDHTIVLLPFPLIYLLIILLILFDIKKISQFIKARKNKNKKKISFKDLLLKGLYFGSAFLGAMVFLFYFLWAFNYERVPIEKHLKIKPEPLDIIGIRSEAQLALQMVTQARQAIPGIKSAGSDALDSTFLPGGVEDKIRKNLERLLKSQDYPTVGCVRVKKLWPGGLLMRFGSSGFYFPFTGEAYVSASLTPVEIPFLLAHEMAHGYGFSREGTANFLAYLTCISSGDAFIKYSGCLVYFNHISQELYKASPEEYKELQKKLPSGIIADQLKKYRNWEQYRGWLMNWGKKVYDTYLKTQGIKKGIKSYNRLVVLAAAWRKARLPKKS